MNPTLSQKYSSKVAVFVDDKVALATETLDRLGRQLKTGQEGVTSPNPLVPAVAQQLGRVSQKLTSLRGDQVVEKAKDQITRHPAALTIAGALTGAALVQLAIMAVRNEQRAATSDARIESNGDTSMMSGAL